MFPLRHSAAVSFALGGLLAIQVGCRTSQSNAQVTQSYQPTAIASPSVPVGPISEADPSIGQSVPLDQLDGLFDEQAANSTGGEPQGPDSRVSSLLWMANVETAAGRLDRARLHLDRALERSPDAAPVLAAVAEWELAHGQVAAAVEHFSQAAERTPEDPQSRVRWATALVAADNEEQGFEVFRQVVSEAAAHYNVGYLLWQRGELEAAYPHIALAVELEPELTVAKEVLLRILQTEEQLAAQRENVARPEPPMTDAVIQKTARPPVVIAPAAHREQVTGPQAAPRPLPIPSSVVIPIQPGPESLP